MSMEKIVLWEAGTVPFVCCSEREENIERRFGGEYIHDVSCPAVYFYPCQEKGVRPALLIAPGGGYAYLSWDLEGTEIAEFFNKAGFSVFILKYRCPDQRQAAHADAARAIRYIRANAARFNIDPEKVAMMGFSAGAHLTATVSAPADAVPYQPVDETDSFSYRPDFSLLIYPAYLADENLNLNKEFDFTPDAPPVFICQTEDDPIHVENALAWFWAAKKAGVPAELHIFAEGGHGYGIRSEISPVSEWHKKAVRWLKQHVGEA